MATDVVMPQMGESIFEGTITKWLKKPGDKVERDEPLFEISTDKVDAEIPSPSAGVLKEIKVNEGQTVPIQTVVAVIDGAGGAAAAPRRLLRRRLLQRQQWLPQRQRPWHHDLRPRRRLRQPLWHLPRRLNGAVESAFTARRSCDGWLPNMGLICPRFREPAQADGSANRTLRRSSPREGLRQRRRRSLRHQRQLGLRRHHLQHRQRRQRLRRFLADKFTWRSNRRCRARKFISATTKSSR